MKEILVADKMKCPFLKYMDNHYRLYECGYNGKDLGFNDPKCNELCELKEGVIIKFDIFTK